MNCPICGREMPEKARKCGNCGCRPKYLYGRPPMPKWVKWAVSVVLGAAILTALALMIIPRLPKDAPTEPTVPSEPAYYELSVRTHSNQRQTMTTIDYTYDEHGNLTEVSPLSLLSSSLQLKTQFLYDSDGVFVGLRQVLDFSDEVWTVGTVTYEEDQVLVQLTGYHSQPIVFRYDSNGRIKDIEYGDYPYVLEHNEDGNILRLYKYNNETQVDGYTWTYREDGTVSWLRQDNGKEYVCVSDEKGNVTELYDSLSRRFVNSFTYETYAVSKRTAQQYELQQYLLFALNITPVTTLQPVVKTAID